MQDYFVKLPNKLLVCDKEDEKSYLEEIKDDKIINILCYLYTNTTRKGESIFIFEDMIEKCGYKLNANKGKINDIFKNVLIKLKEIGILVTDFDLKTLKKNNYTYCNINMFEKDEKGNDTNFIQLYDYEKDLIEKYKDDNVDNLILLKLYCYFKTRMYKRKGDKDIQITGGKAEVCYPSYNLIAKDLAIGQSTIKKYIDILVSINLIRYDNVGLYYPYGNTINKRESANTYVLYDEFGNWESELKEGLKFFKKQKTDEGFIFCKERVYKNNNRKLNGELGALTRLKNKGTATEKQLIRIEEIRDMQTNKNIVDS